jgi:hypothetical protein
MIDKQFSEEKVEKMDLSKALAIDFLLSIRHKKEMQHDLQKYLNTEEGKKLLKCYKAYIASN